ncbi:hypothetical protein E3T55_18730 [Cryobacterium frigoriphilum]|uniref:Uncharacterized protein n=1 Tax=Cryobacterium frigoriphilum TaxID=1259150 RepID=A0A4R8ZTM5_9MICO|nr:hypothetical protein [Cryobacterium frigoriphilum]TFD45409.1 hypothetical protein E3T55_18730 [Cryobacterium frigoriphilum]
MTNSASASVETANLADPATLTQIDVEMQKWGIEEGTRESLLAKHVAGETWDSMNDSEPVSVDERQDGDTQVTTRRYEDGSVSVSMLERPKAEQGAQEGEISARGVASCRVSSSNGVTDYTGCWASESTILISAGFTVNYSTHQTGGAWIRSTGSHSITILSLGAGYADLTLGVTKAIATSSAPATAEMTFRPTGATFGTTCRLKVSVTTGGSASTNAWF